MDSGLDVHVAIPVSKEWERPGYEILECAKNNIRCYAYQNNSKKIGAIREKWINVTGQGYDKDWMFVIGANYRG